MSQDANDRVGARPLSAFSTAEIVGEQEDGEQASSSPQHAATIGITPLHMNAPVLSDDTEDEAPDHANTEENEESILLSQDDHVFGLLRDPHADPPIETHNTGDSSDQAVFASSSQAQQQDAKEDSSDEEYHSPLEDNDETSKPKPIMNASPYEFDVNFNMVGHLRHEERKQEEQQQQSQPPVLNTSLADAAAASMIASTTAAAAAAAPATTQAEQETPPPIPTQQPFSFRKSASTGRRNKPYRYQKYTASSHSEDDEDDIISNIAPSIEEHQAAELPTTTTTTTDTVVSEMNESTSASTSSSSAGAATPTTTSRARRRRHARASSFSHSSPTRQASTTTPQQHDTTPNNRISSLDSGMAAVRRWIRARASGGSSRAARRWQREQSLQLGEEDLFALTHAGEDPRRSSDFFPSILEEEESSLEFPIRQRALSEPNNIRMRNFFFQRAAHGPPSSISSGRSGYRASSRQRRSTSESVDEDGASSRSGSALSSSISVPTHLSSAALNSSLFHSPQRGGGGDLSVNEDVDGVVNDGDVSSLAETSVVPPSTTAPAAETHDDDPNREARTRWIRINRRFQLIITVVALIFSLLLFAILVCWVVFTSAYVVSIDKV